MTEIVSRAPRLPSLRNLRLGLLDSGKTGSTPLMKAVERRLRVELEPAEIHTWKKSSPYRVASRTIVESAVASCDALVFGVVN